MSMKKNYGRQKFPNDVQNPEKKTDVTPDAAGVVSTPFSTPPEASHCRGRGGWTGHFPSNFRKEKWGNQQEKKKVSFEEKNPTAIRNISHGPSTTHTINEQKADSRGGKARPCEGWPDPRHHHGHLPKP